MRAHEGCRQFLYCHGAAHSLRLHVLLRQHVREVLLHAPADDATLLFVGDSERTMLLTPSSNEPLSFLVASFLVGAAERPCEEAATVATTAEIGDFAVGDLAVGVVADSSVLATQVEP